MTQPAPFNATGAEPVLLLHCSAASGRQWEGLVRSLVESSLVESSAESSAESPVIGTADGRLAVTPDLYGYGDAGPWPGPGPLTLGAEAALAAAALPADTAGVHVVGHSYGGAVALRFALEQPQRVRSLTLIEPVAFHVLRQGAPHDRRLLGSVQRVVAGVIEGVLSGDYQLAMQRFVDYWNGEGAWAATSPEGRLRLSRHAPKIVLDFHAAITERTPLDAFRRAFSFPVRILRGDRSPASARRVAELLSERLSGARLDTISGAGHMLPLSHPAETVAAVREQLTAVARSRQAA